MLHRDNGLRLSQALLSIAQFVLGKLDFLACRLLRFESRVDSRLSSQECGTRILGRPLASDRSALLRGFRRREDRREFRRLRLVELPRNHLQSI